MDASGRSIEWHRLRLPRRWHGRRLSLRLAGMRLRFVLLLLGAASLAIACASSDLGGDDHRLNDDDTGDSDRDPDPDATDAERCDACNAGRTCLRGTCVDDCGGDPSTFDPDLAPDLQPIANICHSLPAGSFAAHARGDTAFTLVHMLTEVNGATTFIRLDRYAVALRTGELEHEGRDCELTLTASTPTARIELVRELSLSPAGELAYFTLRETEYMPDHSTVGSRAEVVSSACEITEHARGDYYGYDGSVLLLSEDPNALLVSGGLRTGGSGVLRGPDLLAYGTGAGELQRIGDDGVLAVTSAGHGAIWLTRYATRDLEVGPFPVDGSELPGERWPSRFVALAGRGIVGNSAFEVEDDHFLYDIEVQEEPVPEPERFASPRFTRVIPVDGSRRVLLEHAGGLLVVE